MEVCQNEGNAVLEKYVNFRKLIETIRNQQHSDKTLRNAFMFCIKTERRKAIWKGNKF